MKTHYYDNIRIDWEDGEFERLEKIRAERESKTNCVQAAFMVSPEVKEMAMQYAVSQGMTFSAFVRGIVEGVIKNL
jgi:hypothetical protein